MATQIAEKTKQKEEVTPRGGALAPYREFPFFLSRMRDEFDRLIDRISQEWPSLWEGNRWRWGLDVRDEDAAVVVRAEAPGFEALLDREGRGWAGCLGCPRCIRGREPPHRDAVAMAGAE